MVPIATLTSARSDLFPVGATVTVHPYGAQQVGGPPGAAAIASGVVDSAGLLSITDSDIVSYTRFVLYALVGSEHRYAVARSTLDIFDSGSVVGTGDTTSGSADVANASASAGAFQVGQRLTGPGIPAGATIVSIVSTTLTLSAAATASASGVALKGDSAYVWRARLRRRRAAIGTA